MIIYCGLVVKVADRKTISCGKAIKMDKYRIYYCIDINLWYIDKDDGLVRSTQNPQEIFDSENDAVNFFLRLHDDFLDAQRDMLMNVGQKSTASETECYLQTSDLLYIIAQDGKLMCKLRN